MDSYYYNNSAFYNCNQSPYLAQVNTNSVPEGYNYNFNASRNDTLSSPYQYGYNGYNHQSLSPYIYNENDSAYCSSSDYSNYSLNGTYYNSHVFAANSPSSYTEPSIKKRVREDDSTSPTITIESRAEQSKKRAKVVKLGESDLNIHKLISGRGDNHYICSICSIPFESKAKLLMHEHKYHNGGSSKQCPICLKEFGNQANTLVHLRAHTQEKTFKCNQCHSSFCDSSTLKKHLRTHTGEKPYECHLCSKKFTQSGNLKRHLLVHQKVAEETVNTQMTSDLSPVYSNCGLQRNFEFNNASDEQPNFYSQEVPSSFRHANPYSTEYSHPTFLSTSN